MRKFYLNSLEGGKSLENKGEQLRHNLFINQNKDRYLRVADWLLVLWKTMVMMPVIIYIT